MDIQKTLKFISNSFNFTMNCIFKTTKFIFINMFTIIQLLEHHIEAEVFNFYDIFASFTFPAIIISVIKNNINIFSTKTYQNELDQNKEIIKYVSLFFKNFTFISNFILLIIMLTNIYLIKTSYIYVYFFQIN